MTCLIPKYLLDSSDGFLHCWLSQSKVISFQTMCSKQHAPIRKNYTAEGFAKLELLSRIWAGSSVADCCDGCGTEMCGQSRTCQGGIQAQITGMFIQMLLHKLTSAGLFILYICVVFLSLSLGNHCESLWTPQSKNIILATCFQIKEKKGAWFT